MAPKLTKVTDGQVNWSRRRFEKTAVCNLQKRVLQKFCPFQRVMCLFLVGSQFYFLATAVVRRIFAGSPSDTAKNPSIDDIYSLDFYSLFLVIEGLCDELSSFFVAHRFKLDIDVRQKVGHIRSCRRFMDELVVSRGH